MMRSFWIIHWVLNIMTSVFIWDKEGKMGKKKKQIDPWKWNQIGMMWTKTKACNQNLKLAKKSSTASTGITALVTACFWISGHLNCEKLYFFPWFSTFVVVCYHSHRKLILVASWFLAVPEHLTGVGSMWLSSVLLHCVHHLQRTMLRALPPIYCPFQIALSLPSHSSFLYSYLWDLTFDHSTCSDFTCHVVYLPYESLSSSFDNWTLLFDTFIKGPKLSVFSKEISDFDPHWICLQ